MAETTKKTIVFPQTGDKYTHIHHKSGLEILVCEMEATAPPKPCSAQSTARSTPSSRPRRTRTTAPCRRASPTSWNTSCSRTRTATCSTCTPRLVPTPTRSPRSTRPAISSAAPTTSRLRWRSCSPLSSRRTSRRKALPRNRALSGRRSACATTTPAGGYSSTCCAVCTRSIRFASTSPAPLRALRKLQTICCTAATARSTTSTTWYWQLPESARWTRCWRLPTGC